MANDPIVDLKLNLDISGVNDALYNMIGTFKGTDKQFAAISASIDKNAKILEASIKRFGPASKEAENASKSLQKVLTSLVANGIDPLDNSFKKLQSSLPQVSNAINSASNSTKKSNMQFTNLALILQDLPYGFRGIQNNLPALAAGFAGVTGPIYLAVSALIAIWTSFGDEITKVIFKTSEMSKNSKLLSDSFKGIENTVVQASVSVDKMNFMIDEAKKGFIDKDKVVKVYNETLGKTIGQQNNFNGVVEAMKSKGEKYIELVTMMSFANALAAQSAKEAFTALMAEVKAPEEALGTIQKFGKGALSSVEYLINTIRGKTDKMTPLSDALYGAVGMVEKGKEVQAANKTTKFLDDFLKNVKTEISKFARENKFNIFDFGTGGETKISTKALDALKSQAKLYQEDLFTKRYYNLLVLKEEERIALAQAEIDKVSKNELASIAEDFKNRRLLIEQETQNGIQSIRNKDADNQAIFEENQLKSMIDSYKKQLDIFDDFYKNRQNLATGDRLAKKSIYEQESGDLLYMLNNNFITYDDYLSRMSNVFKNWTNNNTAITKESLTNIMNYGRGIMSALGPSLDLLLDKGASINEVLDKAFKDLVKQITKVTIAAAIAVTLMAAMGIVKGKDIGKVFGMLFSQGMGLGNLGFTAPTAAASSTPSSMSSIDTTTSASGMSFVLKGQDLLLSVNRAQKASTLKGQNISLG